MSRFRQPPRRDIELICNVLCKPFFLAWNQSREHIRSFPKTDRRCGADSLRLRRPRAAGPHRSAHPNTTFFPIHCLPLAGNQPKRQPRTPGLPKPPCARREAPDPRTDSPRRTSVSEWRDARRVRRCVRRRPMAPGDAAPRSVGMCQRRIRGSKESRQKKGGRREGNPRGATRTAVRSG